MKKTPLPTLIDTLMRERLKTLSTSTVGHILTFDASSQRAQVQPGIQRVDLDGNVHNPPPINDVPVVFIGGSTSHIEFEVKPNDEGLLLFSQRNLDGWKQSGGVAPNPTARFHNMQDCIFIHGVRSLPQAVQGFENNGIRMRHGDNHVWIKNDGTIVSSNAKASHTIGADGSFEFDNGAGFIRVSTSGEVTINGFTIPPIGKGEASFDGTISAKDMKAGSISLKDHTHTGVQAGGDDTGKPQ